MNCNSDEKVSVIVPVYNVESKISKCIESIVNQTYDNLEIILINDGSNDRSGDICKSYEEKDSRIIAVDKKNEGVSKTRNLGIDMSTGKYLMFVDSDDTIPEDAVEILYKPIKECSVEYSAGNVKHIKNGRQIFDYAEKQLKDIVTDDFSEIGKSIYFNQGYSIAKLYNSQIIKTNNIRFNAKYSLGEDSLFVKQYLAHIKSISVTNKFVYEYIHEDTKSLSGKYVENIKEIYSELYDANKRLKDRYGDVTNYSPKVIAVSTAEINNIYKNRSPYKNKKDRIDFINERIKSGEFKKGLKQWKTSSKKQTLSKMLYSIGSAALIDLFYSRMK